MRLTSFTFALIVIATSIHESWTLLVEPPRLGEFDKAIQASDKSKTEKIVDLNAVPIETTTQIKKPQSSRYVHLEQWNCGAGSLDQWFAHLMTEQECPQKMVETNECCLAHDICYTEHLSQEECDISFCQCLDDVLKKEGCGHIANIFCNAVKTFGADAHKKSKDYGKNETETSTVVSSTTALPSTTTTEIPLIKKVDETEKYLFQRAVNKSLDHSCFEELKEGKCTFDLNTCDDEGFTCIYKFCECSHNTLFSGPALKRAECRSNLEQLCGNYFVTEFTHSNTNNWIEENFGLTVPQVVIIIVCLLVSFGSASFWIVRYVCRRRKAAAESKGFINDANSSSNSSSASFFNFMSDDKENAPLNCMPLLGP